MSLYRFVYHIHKVILVYPRVRTADIMQQKNVTIAADDDDSDDNDEWRKTEKGMKLLTHAEATK